MFSVTIRRTEHLKPTRNMYSRLRNYTKKVKNAAVNRHTLNRLLVSRFKISVYGLEFVSAIN